MDVILAGVLCVFGHHSFKAHHGKPNPETTQGSVGNSGNSWFKMQLGGTNGALARRPPGAVTAHRAGLRNWLVAAAAATTGAPGRHRLGGRESPKTIV